MMIHQPPQAPKPRDNFHPNLIELHFFISFDRDIYVARDIHPSFCKLRPFEDTDLEDFAFVLPAEDVEGDAAKGGSGVDEGGDVG